MGGAGGAGGAGLSRSDPQDEPVGLFFFFSKIKYGGTIPRSYYIRDSVEVQYEHSVTVSRGSVFQLEVQVPAAGSLLRY